MQSSKTNVLWFPITIPKSFELLLCINPRKYRRFCMWPREPFIKQNGSIGWSYKTNRVIIICYREIWLTISNHRITISVSLSLAVCPRKTQIIMPTIYIIIVILFVQFHIHSIPPKTIAITGNHAANSVVGNLSCHRQYCSNNNNIAHNYYLWSSQICLTDPSKY